MIICGYERGLLWDPNGVEMLRPVEPEEDSVLSGRHLV